VPRLSETARLAVVAGLLSAWLVLLFAGWIAGGAIHLLPVVAAALFPWRLLKE